MSTLQGVYKDIILAEVAADNTRFTFPRSSHLIIATPRHIFAWDASGIHKIFQSSRNGIIAAREAKDGSGLLAVASKDVVVLHDTKRGKEHSWGLNAPDEELRHLEYSQDAKMLYLSTTSHGLIQQYSLEKYRLLEPLQKHESAPVALAVSCTGDLMLSASSDPPAIFLKRMTPSSTSTLIQPTSSTAAVCTAAFHPERPNIFMLGFRDGTVAAFDATKIVNITGTYETQLNFGWEISSFQNLHRKVTTENIRSESTSIFAPIAGVAFLPGYKLRAVTAGRDGRCRIIDFAKGGIVLRTWHCKEPCTALAILAGFASGSVRAATTGNGERSEGQDQQGEVIAVGLADGTVQLYNSLGLLLAQQRVSSRGEKIISVEWSVGSAPVAINDATLGNFDDADPDISLNAVRSIATSAPVKPRAGNVTRQQATKNGLGLPSSLSRGQGLPTQQVQRQLIFHPDEIDTSTVRRTPISKQQIFAPSSGQGYKDLFAPGERDPPLYTFRRQVSSPPRNRPRISSQTFIRFPTSSIKSTRSRRGTRACSTLAFAGRTSSASSTARQKGVATKDPLGVRQQEQSQLPRSRSQGRQIAFKSAGVVPGDAAIASFRPRPNRQKTRSRGRPIVRAKTSPIQGREHEEDLWLTSDNDENLANCEVPRRRDDKHRYQAILGQSPHQDGHSSQGSLATHAYVAPGKGLSAVSSDVRQLFPRTSSLSPRIARNTTELQDAANGSRSIPRKQNDGATDVPSPRLCSPIAPATKNPKTPWTRVRAGKDASQKRRNPKQEPDRQAVAPTRFRSIKKNPFVTVLLQSDGSIDVPAVSPERPAGLTRSPSFDCLTCAGTQARVQVLEEEVQNLESEVSKLKSMVLRGAKSGEQKRSWR
ncbi:hypothetical protein CKM354_000250400 [Cercospora kikuchii]|uniref:WD40 repeat-like protein n=1 Tax=Cercospora kikuchii TaxID=84275 RepID=A0A9P3CA81_9PEZI|nr:uncharacterized protein CKM354_000250400 [Cercospora kikuchii]GIZ39113.1 hypothetical protein CKM354_000250400 [Cercospora kikuchii]